MQRTRRMLLRHKKCITKQTSYPPLYMASVSELSAFVVEPSTAQSQFVLNRLKSVGVTLTTVFKDGASALEAMRDRRPDIVFSSMHLPDMTGGDLVAHMRADSVTQYTAFVLISSETRPFYLEPVRQSGSCAILGKPFSVEQLKRALATAMDYLNPQSDALVVGEGVSLETIRVLLVDDSRNARLHIRRVLGNLGIQDFTEAENGKQGAEIIDQQFFDLVVTDYNMPEMDGKELTEYIRTKSWQSTVPILMVSSESNESRLAAVQQAGVSGVCDKPFEPAVVRGLLQKMLKAQEA